MITVKGTQACKAEFRVQKLWSCDMSDVWRMRDVGGSNWGVCDEGSKKETKRPRTYTLFILMGNKTCFSVPPHSILAGIQIHPMAMFSSAVSSVTLHLTRLKNDQHQ